MQIMAVQKAVILLTALSTVHAWMPWDHELAAFNASARRSAEGFANQKRSLPDFDKIRGVNLGAWLVSEPWMMSGTWQNTMGCGNSLSEWGCMTSHSGGESAANDAFKDHYNSWINPATIQSIHDVGLNTIRIPMGFWSNKDLVNDDEHYPDGGNQLSALDAVVSKASQLGIYVIIDLHGAPGAQVPQQPFTGRYADQAMFYEQDNYDRAAKWLSWMTTRIHTTKGYETVGAIEVLNEPMNDNGGPPRPESEKSTMRKIYYPQALKAVRDAEAKLGISSKNQLSVEFMDTLWAAGDPTLHLPTNDPNLAFDDHNYYTYNVKGGSAKDTHQSDLLYKACHDDRTRDSLSPKMVQEWSLVVWDQLTQSEFDRNSNKDFFKKFFAAQQQSYEKTNGWVFWSWKTNLNDYRWTYSDATYQGVIPNSAGGLDGTASQSVC